MLIGGKPPHIWTVFVQGQPHKEKAWLFVEPGLFRVARLSAAFEGQGYALAATDAQGRQAFPGIALDHFMQQGDQHAAA